MRGGVGAQVMLGFDADERMIQKLPQDFAAKTVWGSHYPRQETTTAWDAIAQLSGAGVDEAIIARMLGANAAAQFGVSLQKLV